MDSTNQRFFAPCPRGLEEVLTEELTGLGALAASPTAGGVAFHGPLRLCYRANLESRLASRILWKVADTRYETEADLYRTATRLPWSEWFGSQRTIKVKVSAQQCPLKSLDFATLRVKDGICDHFVRVVGTRPNVDTACPDHLVVVFLDANEATFYLDTSGDPLFKRGWRRARGDAPLRENLAAGILRLAGWAPDRVLCDPMCGAGTVAIEAAMIARHLAPGLGRHFAFEGLRWFEAQVWNEIRAQARATRQECRPGFIYASDHNGAAINAARRNLVEAGVSAAVVLRQADVLKVPVPAPTGHLLTNPPYGRRLGQLAELRDLYPRLGDRLKRDFPGWTAWFLTADHQFPTLLRLRPFRRVPLMNGALECRLYGFQLVAGPIRLASKTRPDESQERKTFQQVRDN